MSEFIRLEIMRILQAHRGRENAIPRHEILSHLRMFKRQLADRDFRELYVGLPICSCPEGLFIPIRPEEVAEFRAYLEKKVGPIIAHRRVATILAFYPRLAPTWKQQNLFEGENHA